jgi:hypothetical protein
MGKLVSQETLTAIINRDKKAEERATCAECAGPRDDLWHGEPVGHPDNRSFYHAYAPYLSRAAKDRRLLIRTLNNISEEWGTYEAARKIDRMLLDIIFPPVKAEGD